MIQKDDIIIRKSILHILDTDHGNCTLSDTLLNPGPDLYDFIRGHIYKIVSSDDTKACEFNRETSPAYSILSKLNEEEEDSFIRVSRSIAERLYLCMCDSPDIPAADLLFVSFQVESEIFLALLKLNYRESYTHEVSVEEPPEENPEENPWDEDGDADTEDDLDEDVTDTEAPAEPLVAAGIVKSRSLFPAATSRLPEAAVFSLPDYHIRLLEKAYEINGEKTPYLSEKFLVCNTDLPPKKKLNILTKVINNISNKYDGADVKAKMDTKSALQREFSEQNAFDVEEIGAKLFGNSPEKKAEYDEKMERYDLQYDSFTVANESTVKRLERQVMVTDSGIEISIPMDAYNTHAHVDIQTDPQGKSTIIIRNIDNLTLK